MLFRKRAGKIVVPLAAALVLASPATGTVAGDDLHSREGALRAHARTTLPVRAAQEAELPKEGRLAAYRHLGTWVDMYDKGPWADPERAVRRMKRKGVTTLYLQTANYAKPRKDTIYRRGRTERLLIAAHAEGIKVVAWYLPSFKKMRRDWRRTKAALTFQARDGQRFDSFALDIESTREADVATRNRRLKELTKRIRNKVGSDYPLGAIVPDVHTSYWTWFPYRMLNRHYDVFLPMGYFSFRVGTRKGAYSHTRDNIWAIRDRTGDPNVKIHPIGGIAGRVGDDAARGFVGAVKDGSVLGGSYYDFPITTRSEWTVLGRLAR